MNSGILAAKREQSCQRIQLVRKRLSSPKLLGLEMLPENRPLLLLLAMVAAKGSLAVDRARDVADAKFPEVSGEELSALGASVQSRLAAAGITALSSAKPAPPGVQTVQWL